MEMKEWFSTWFDTQYYHTLYKNRDDSEAKKFISNLLHFLQLPKDKPVLDLACGKGRHSITLNEAGYKVLGVDLSKKSMEKAKAMEKKNLQFAVHDMREVIPNKKFQAVFNLFTSFGYFENTKDNEKVLQSIHAMLEENGILVIDFMNAKKAVADLVTEETKEVDGIQFQINRRFDGQHIFKNIQFDADNKHYNYTERVQALTLRDFKTLLENTGLQLIQHFGDFNLNPFEESTSNRLILIAKKQG